MKVAYLFESEHAREILENMIIPQLEEDRHGVEVAGCKLLFQIGTLSCVVIGVRCIEEESRQLAE